MLLQGLLQISLTLFLVALTTPVLGRYLAQVFMMKATPIDRAVDPIDRLIYQLGGVDAEEDMTGWEYTIAVLTSNTAMAIFVFLLLMFQGFLPLNPTGLGMPTWDTALHTSISFMQ